MKDLRTEINWTINAMQADICEESHTQLCDHLHELLAMVRNKLACGYDGDHSDAVNDALEQLFERINTTGELENLSKGAPLTAEELKAGGWWCADVSEECRRALVNNGVGVAMSSWEISDTVDYVYKFCDSKDVLLAFYAMDLERLKQIHRIGNEFYWSDK